MADKIREFAKSNAKHILLVVLLIVVSLVLFTLVNKNEKAHAGVVTASLTISQTLQEGGRFFESSWKEKIESQTKKDIRNSLEEWLLDFGIDTYPKNVSRFLDYVTFKYMEFSKQSFNYTYNISGNSITVESELVQDPKKFIEPAKNIFLNGAKSYGINMTEDMKDDMEEFIDDIFSTGFIPKKIVLTLEFSENKEGLWDLIAHVEAKKSFITLKADIKMSLGETLNPQRICEENEKGQKICKWNMEVDLPWLVELALNAAGVDVQKEITMFWRHYIARNFRLRIPESFSEKKGCNLIFPSGVEKGRLRFRMKC